MSIEGITIKKAREKLDSGEISSVDLTQSCLDAIQKRDDDIHAYLEVFDDVLEQAAQADDRLRRGEHVEPLTGIPIALKDNILIKGRKAGAASKILENYTATYDASVIEKLKKEGAIFLGRTNMDEFAMGASTENSAYGPTKNPLDVTRVPGGSSGGSTAAVAAGMALGALGSDTGGSIRQPSSYCGVVGLKPTYGAVSRSGLIALGSSLDVIGPITKTVSDAEILFNVIRGIDPLDSTSVDGSDFSNDSGLMTHDLSIIGVPMKFLEESGIGKTTLKKFNESIEKLRSCGYKIEKIDIPNIKFSVPTYYIILPAEASTNLARFDGVRYGLHVSGTNSVDDYFQTKGVGFGAEPRRRILIGTHVLSSGYKDQYYNRATALRNLIKADFQNAFSKVDVIVMPTTAGTAFKLGEKSSDPVKMYLEDVFTSPANLTGLPALSVPSGKTNGLPLGLQIIAPHHREDYLFEVGKKFCGE